MSDREELLNLVRNGVRCPESAKTCSDCQYHSTKYPMHCDEDAALVDMLVAHGVTIGGSNRDCHWATEVAYKNGYEAGKRDTMEKLYGRFGGEVAR